MKYYYINTVYLKNTITTVAVKNFTQINFFQYLKNVGMYTHIINLPIEKYLLNSINFYNEIINIYFLTLIMR